jgi:hypothetical protein
MMPSWRNAGHGAWTPVAWGEVEVIAIIFQQCHKSSRFRTILK